MRSSWGTPSSNSWLPTPLYCRPIALKASIVGSSWKSPDRSGLAPIRSPDDVSSVFAGFCVRSCLYHVARYSAPPASTVTGVPFEIDVTTRPFDPVGGCRFPWKSLIPRIWTCTAAAAFFFVASAATHFALPLTVTAFCPALQRSF
jgi:hypothetical protein